jgi:hypothetical protein
MILLLILGHFLFAGEPDNMLGRSMAKASDAYANEDINRVVNTTLKLRLDQYNNFKQGCKPEKLYEFLKEDFDKNFPGIYESTKLNVPFVGPLKSDQLPYKNLLKGKGVCAVKNSFNAPYNSKSYSPTVKVQAKGKTFYIGLDKIDHFFSHGFYYWKAMEQDKSGSDEKLQRMLDLGMAQEDGVWGLKCYSVKSYGDLSANYHGIAFWQDLLRGKPPIIACEKGQYVQKKPFDIANYIDASMDESINCNSYDSAATLNSLAGEWAKRKLKCPADDDATCADLRKSLPKNVQAKILHPRCLGTGSGQVEKPSEITTQDYLDAITILLLDKQVPPRSAAPAKDKATQ